MIMYQLFVAPIWQVSKLRLRKIKASAQSHRANTCWSLDLNPKLSGKPEILPKTLSKSEWRNTALQERPSVGAAEVGGGEDCPHCSYRCDLFLVHEAHTQPAHLWPPSARHVYHLTYNTSGGGHSSPLQCSCLENPTDRGAWWATVHGVTESQT